MRRAPTIRQVAEHAGVSKSLVSLVLQGSPKVSPQKRAAVQAAIDELGYRPNAVARSLTERRTRIVGVLLNDLRNPWFVDCLEGLGAELHGSGLRMFMADSRLDRRMGESLTEGFRELRVDGLAVVGTVSPSESLARIAAEIPTVVAASRDVHLPNVDVVANDDVAGTRLALDHLRDLGHRRIAHVSGTIGEVARIRRDTFIAEMHSAGLDPVLEPCDMTEEGGYRAAVRLFRAERPPTAIFAVNDMACVGALSAADELGITVPQQVSLVGYDNTHLAGIRHLWLTSVDNASFEVGRRAGRALLHRISAPTAPASEQLVDPRLQVRGSTAEPPRQRCDS